MVGIWPNNFPSFRLWDTNLILFGKVNLVKQTTLISEGVGIKLPLNTFFSRKKCIWFNHTRNNSYCMLEKLTHCIRTK